MEKTTALTCSILCRATSIWTLLENLQQKEEAFHQVNSLVGRRLCRNIHISQFTFFSFCIGALGALHCGADFETSPEIIKTVLFVVR